MRMFKGCHKPIFPYYALVSKIVDGPDGRKTLKVKAVNKDGTLHQSTHFKEGGRSNIQITPFDVHGKKDFYLNFEKWKQVNSDLFNVEPIKLCNVCSYFEKN